MPLTDDNFAKNGKLEGYTKIIDELYDNDNEDNEEPVYDLNLEEEKKQDNEEEDKDDR